MLFRNLAVLILAALLCFQVSAAEKKSKDSAPAAKPSYELPQPTTENLDLTIYQRIRDEGLAHSHVMEYASALMDGIGPRLTGSPNLRHANGWTRDQFTAMGCSNAHLEDWGEFGMGWRQLNTWIRMTAPDTAVFIAQALPWSPASHGPISGRAVWVDAKEDKDLDKYKGKLAGKIVFFGDMRAVPPSTSFFMNARTTPISRKSPNIPFITRTSTRNFRNLSKSWSSARKLDNFSPRNRPWRLLSPAATVAMAADPAARSSMTAAQAWDGSPTSVSTQNLCLLWSPPLRITAAFTALSKPTFR
jgi:hypothetical protein